MKIQDASVIIKKTAKKKKSSKLLIVVSLCLLIGGFWFAYTQFRERQLKQDELAALRELFVQEANASDSDIDPNLLRKIDFDSLHAVAPEAARWLYVPNTALDGAIMQESVPGEYKYDLNDMYGNYNGFGTYAIPAAPIDTKTGQMMDDAHTLVLAHRMHDYNGEWQFSNVPTRWGDAEGAEEFPYIYIYYPDRAERWKVWAGTDSTGGDMMYRTPYELGSDEYATLIQHINETARYTRFDAPDKLTRTLVLSTCNNEDLNDGRYHVTSVPDATYYYENKKLEYYDDIHADTNKNIQSTLK